jgi:hypothetical protein
MGGRDRHNGPAAGRSVLLFLAVALQAERDAFAAQVEAKAHSDADLRAASLASSLARAQTQSNAAYQDVAQRMAEA